MTTKGQHGDDSDELPAITKGKTIRECIYHGNADQAILTLEDGTRIVFYAYAVDITLPGAGEGA